MHERSPLAHSVPFLYLGLRKESGIIVRGYGYPGRPDVGGDTGVGELTCKAHIEPLFEIDGFYHYSCVDMYFTCTL